MARPESEPKTPLARRLREARRHFGDEERDTFASRLGLSKSALARYERGENPPDAVALAKYHEHLGVSLHWLVAGEGEMFADPSKMPARPLDPDLLEKLARIVTSVHRDAGIRLAGEKITVEAADLYNELMARVDDPSDPEEIEATLPQLRHLLKKRLAEAASLPGTGKHSA